MANNEVLKKVNTKDVTFKEVKDQAESIIDKTITIDSTDQATFDSYENTVVTWWQKIRGFKQQMAEAESALEKEVDRLRKDRQITIFTILDEKGIETTIKGVMQTSTHVDRERVLEELDIDLSKTFNALDANGNPVYVDSSGKQVPDVLKRAPLPPISISKYKAAKEAGVVRGLGLVETKTIQTHIDTYKKEED